MSEFLVQKQGGLDTVVQLLTCITYSDGVGRGATEVEDVADDPALVDLHKEPVRGAHALAAGAYTRPLFWLNLSAFCGIGGALFGF
jgi:hypothetical protein